MSVCFVHDFACYLIKLDDSRGTLVRGDFPLPSTCAIDNGTMNTGTMDNGTMDNNGTMNTGTMDNGTLLLVFT